MPSFRYEEPKLWCQIAWVRFLFLSINWPSVNGKFSFYFPKQKHRLPEFRSTRHLTNNFNATPSKNPTHSGTRRNKNEGAKVNHMAKRFENPQQCYNKNWCNFIWFLCVFDACERCQVKQPSLNKTHALTKNERKPIKNCKIWTIESECLTKSSCQMQTNSIRMQFWCCDSSMCKRDHRYKMRFCLSICSAMCWFQLLSYMSKRH